MPVFKAQINPLKCPEIDFTTTTAGSHTAECLLDYLFAPEVDRGCGGEEATVAFDSLRQIRRRYLHFFSQSHDQLANDARRAYKSAL
jgi:hypothetical protein